MSVLEDTVLWGCSGTERRHGRRTASPWNGGPFQAGCKGLAMGQREKLGEKEKGGQQLERICILITTRSSPVVVVFFLIINVGE